MGCGGVRGLVVALRNLLLAARLKALSASRSEIPSLRVSACRRVRLLLFRMSGKCPFLAGQIDAVGERRPLVPETASLQDNSYPHLSSFSSSSSSSSSMSSSEAGGAAAVAVPNTDRTDAGLEPSGSDAATEKEAPAEFVGRCPYGFDRIANERSRMVPVSEEEKGDWIYQFIESKPREWRALFSRATQQLYGEGMFLFSEALKAWSARIPERALQGAVQAHERLKEVAQQLLDAEPADRSLWSDMGVVAAKLGLWTTALGDEKRGAEFFDAARTHFVDCAGDLSGYAMLQLQRASMLMREDTLDLCRSLIDEAVRLRREVIASGLLDPLQARFDLAVALGTRARVCDTKEQALQLLDEAIAILEEVGMAMGDRISGAHISYENMYREMRDMLVTRSADAVST